MYVDMNNLVTNDGAMLLGDRGLGAVGQLLDNVQYQPGMLRPFIDSRGERCVILNNGFKDVKGVKTPIQTKHRVSDLQARGFHSPVFNAMTLPKESWIMLDTTIVKATRQRLRAWTDMMQFSGRSVPGMSVMTLEYQAMNDPGEAVVDMDSMTAGRRDRPLFNLNSTPLPITHSDFYFSEREIAVSRRGGMGLDTTMAEAAARRVAETVEQTVIGTVTGVTYGTRSGDAATAHTGASSVWGYTNFPYRTTKTDLTTPTGANGNAVVQDIIEMRETMYANGFFGPFLLYHSTNYDQYLDADYAFTNGSNWAVNPTQTLRDRIRTIAGISDVRRLDYLTSGYQLIMVQLSSDVVQAINGMDMTTVQWETMGGSKQNFKVMCIHVPLLKKPYNGVSGVLHATTA